MKKASINKIEAAKFNPLADYAKQIKTSSYKNSKKIRDTSLSEHVVFPLMGLNNDTDISFREEKGNFPFCKLINNAANFHLISSLTPTSGFILLLILMRLEFLSDQVQIPFDKFSKLLSVNTFNKSIAELESKGIILRIGIKRNFDYWHFFINPQIIYRGDAKKFYKQVIDLNPHFLNKTKK